MARQRFFRYGELPLVVLHLLDREALRGFDVMSELDRLFGPAYNASAGSVYPALGALEAEQLIKRTKSDPSRYELTAEGRRALRTRRDALSRIENRTGVRLGTVDELDAALRRFVARITPLEGRVPVPAVEAILDDAADRISCLLTSTGGNDGRRI
ncbi:MAG TPA: PadR family transcriptional regulator [Acidimicrobiales bacterium]